MNKIRKAIIAAQEDGEHGIARRLMKILRKHELTTAHK